MILYTASNHSAKKWKPEDITWTQLVDRLRTPIRTGETEQQYRSMSPEQRSSRKDQGGFLGGELRDGLRKKENVVNRCLVCLDADHAQATDWEDFSELYDDITCCLYSTHSHTTASPRFRWIFPLSRPVTPEEYIPIARLLASWIDIETMDASTYQVERLMYFPSCPADGDYVFHEQSGHMLDPDQLLTHYYRDWTNTAEWPMSSREDTIILREVKRQGDPLEKEGIIGAFCRAYSIEEAISEFLPEVYTPCDGMDQRYTYTGGTSSAGAIVYDDGRFLFSHHEHDPICGKLCNAFDLVRIHKFGELDTKQIPEVTKRPSYQEMCRWAASQSKVFQELYDISDEELFASGEDWTKQLEVNKKSGLLEQTIDNCRLVMTHDPFLQGACGFDLMKSRPVLRKKTWRDPTYSPDWEDSDSSQLRSYLEKKWKLTGIRQIEDAWVIVCTENSFHPIRDYLNAQTWDGIPRVETLLIRYFNSPDNSYVRAVTRKWMAGAVARVMSDFPVQMDSMLLLVGGQGIGKSRFGKILFLGYVSDAIRDISDKDSRQELQGKWCIEIAEMSAFRNKEIEAIKNYISAPSDTYRPSYGRFPVDRRRQCVFFGTSNSYNCLKDQSGGRRFWPVAVPGKDRGQHFGLKEEVNQLWAEAVQLWKNGETLWLDNEEDAAFAAAEQKKFTEVDELEDQIQDFLDRKLPDDWYDRSLPERRDFILDNTLDKPEDCTLERTEVSVAVIRVELLGMDLKDYGKMQALPVRIGDILSRTKGWKAQDGRHRIPGYNPTRVYVRT